MRSEAHATATEVRWSPEAQDARNLALEIAGLRPAMVVDTMPLGIALEPGETAHRATWLWLSMRFGSTWTVPEWCQVLVTDRRLVCRLPDRGLACLWWGAVVGFEPDLVRGSVLLDFGDGRPRALAGPSIALVAVAGATAIYGVEALARHPALIPLRTRGVLG